MSSQDGKEIFKILALFAFVIIVVFLVEPGMLESPYNEF
jgi:hypothetical protein